MLIFTPNWFRYRLLGPSHPGISKLAHAALLHFSVGTGTNLLSWASLRHADNCLSLGASQASQKLALAKKSFVGASRCFESGLCAKLALAKTTFVGASQVRRNWLSQRLLSWALLRRVPTGSRAKSSFMGASQVRGASQLALAKTTFVGASQGASQLATRSRKDHFRGRFSGASQLALAKTAFLGASQACPNWFSQRKKDLSWALLRCVATGSRKDCFTFVGASHQACRNWFSQRSLSWEPLSWALLRCVATGSRKGRFRVLFPGSSKLALANTAFVTFVCASQVCVAYTSRLLGPSHRYVFETGSRSPFLCGDCFRGLLSKVGRRLPLAKDRFRVGASQETGSRKDRFRVGASQVPGLTPAGPNPNRGCRQHPISLYIRVRRPQRSRPRPLPVKGRLGLLKAHATVSWCPLPQCVAVMHRGKTFYSRRSLHSAWITGYVGGAKLREARVEMDDTLVGSRVGRSVDR